jgi:glycosyltransferase involved in cell wall biosynthesis
MKVLLSTLTFSPTAVHGGPIVAARHASALVRHGAQVCVTAPLAQQPPGALDVEGYKPSRHGLFLDKRPDAYAGAALDRIIERHRPDILYDVHGPAWAVDAAVRARLPVVSMVGDYGWFCRRSVLVDVRVQRCTGPESLEKCFACLNGAYSAKRRMAHSVLRHAARLGVHAPKGLDSRANSLFLWESLTEAERYVASLRDKVDRFVVGDRHAWTFMLEQGTAPHKLAAIAQCLPDEALRVRRSAADGIPGRTRPLRIAFVGRPHPDKGLHVLARALELLPEDSPFELWIVHAHWATPPKIEPSFPSAARFRRGLAAGRIRLFRPGDSDAVFQIMAQADVGVIPSIAYESPSLVMLEFVAQRTPLVRSESAGMDHVIQDGVNGRTFPYGDSQALAAILREIAAEPTLLDRWRARLPAIDSDSHYAAQLVRLFEEAVAGRNAALTLAPPEDRFAIDVDDRLGDAVPAAEIDRGMPARREHAPVVEDHVAPEPQPGV